jgi:hypothetical protein
MDGQRLLLMQTCLDILIPKDPMIKYRLPIPEMEKTVVPVVLKMNSSVLNLKESN